MRTTGSCSLIILPLLLRAVGRVAGRHPQADAGGGGERKIRSERVEEPDDVAEVDPAVAVDVESGDRLVRGDPRELVEEEHDVREVLPAVLVQVVVRPVVVRVRRENRRAGDDGLPRG